MSTACVEYLARGAETEVHSERFAVVVLATHPNPVGC